MRNDELSLGLIRQPIAPGGLIAWAALSVALNVGLARFTYGIMLPSLRRDLGLDYLTSGTFNSIHLLGCLTGTLVAQLLVRRIGLPVLLTRAHVMVAAGALLCAVTPQTAQGLAVLGVGRLATGIGAGAGIVGILVAAFSAVPARERPLAGAMIWSGIGAAVVISACAVPFLLESAIGWRMAFAGSALLALTIAVLFPSNGTPDGANGEAAVVSRARFSAAALLSGRWLFLNVSYLLFGAAYMAYSTFASAQLAAAYTPVNIIALTWAAFGIAAIAGAVLTVPVLRAKRLKRFAFLGAVVSGGLGALMAWTNWAGAAVGGAILVGLGVAATPAVVSAYVRDRCGSEEYAKAFSYATAMLGVGQIVSPVIAGALADLFGTAAEPLFAAIAYFIGALFAVCDAATAHVE